LHNLAALRQSVAHFLQWSVVYLSHSFAHASHALAQVEHSLFTFALFEVIAEFAALQAVIQSLQSCVQTDILAFLSFEHLVSHLVQASIASLQAAMHALYLSFIISLFATVLPFDTDIFVVATIEIKPIAAKTKINFFMILFFKGFLNCYT